jgi:hypothetical protein
MKWIGAYNEYENAKFDAEWRREQTAIAGSGVLRWTWSRVPAGQPAGPSG